MWYSSCRYYKKCTRQAWNVVYEFQAHDQYLLKCVLSPDANSLATTSADKTIRLWRVFNTVNSSRSSDSGGSNGPCECELIRSLSQHQKWVWDAVFSADSFYLVSVSSDLSGKLWDLRTGSVIQNYSGHNLAVTCVALHDSNH
jgi:G protein beta subunit-like protein